MPVSNSNARPADVPCFGRLRCVLVCAMVILASGCAGHPKDVLLPVADTAPSSSKVDMLVATTRSRSSVPGEMFTGERGLTPAFADITLSIPPKNVRKEGEVAWSTEYG
jgi:esterase/lipase superfamily enzyme